MTEYKLHFIAPNPACPPRAEGEVFKDLESCQQWADLINAETRQCLGRYEALPIDQ